MSSNYKVIMNTIKKIKTLVILAILLPATLLAQSQSKQWSLTECINYALENNIQIQKAKVNLQTNEISTKEAKVQLLPNLSASIGQNVNAYPFGNSSLSYSGSYGLSSSMLLFDGGKTQKNIQQQKLNEDLGRYSILESEKSIQMSILQTYAKILYADEAVKVYQETVKTSEYQFNRGKEMLTVGSISGVDLAQLESQLSSDKYQLVMAQNTLSTSKLELKQLLELNPDDNMDLIIPSLTSFDILKPLTSLQSIYQTSLNVMPQIKAEKAGIQIAQLDTEKAKAGFLPKVNLTGSVGTGHNTNYDSSLGNQLRNGLNAGVGVAVSIPILTNRQNKSTLEKTRLSEKTDKLNMQDAEKSLLKEIESVYQDALSAQSQYQASIEKVQALEKSYNLIQQQFNLGMKNTLELLTEKNNLLSARQSLMQSNLLK